MSPPSSVADSHYSCTCHNGDSYNWRITSPACDFYTTDRPAVRLLHYLSRPHSGPSRVLTIPLGRLLRLRHGPLHVILRQPDRRRFVDSGVPEACKGGLCLCRWPGYVLCCRRRCQRMVRLDHGLARICSEMKCKCYFCLLCTCVHCGAFSPYLSTVSIEKATDYHHRAVTGLIFRPQFSPN